MNKTEMRKNLLPCPFCGTKPSFSEGHSSAAGVGSTWNVTITCESNRCAINPQLSAYIPLYKVVRGTGSFETIGDVQIGLRKKALGKWNTRKDGKTNKKR